MNVITKGEQLVISSETDCQPYHTACTMVKARVGDQDYGKDHVHCHLRHCELNILIIAIKLMSGTIEYVVPTYRLKIK